MREKTKLFRRFGCPPRFSFHQPDAGACVQILTKQPRPRFSSSGKFNQDLYGYGYLYSITNVELERMHNDVRMATTSK